MKTLPALLAFTLLLGATPVWAAAPSVITVTGQGRVNAAPDMATAQFTIATNADTASAATSDNNTRYERFLNAAKALGIVASDIQTTGFNVSYTPPPQAQAGNIAPVQPPQRYGYFVNRSVNVTLHRLPLVGKTIDAAVASGVTDIGGVTFGISDRRTQVQRAIREAVDDARAQAQAMASAAGLHITGIKSVGQGYPSIVQPGIAADVYRMAAPAAAPTNIEPSNVEVNATVTVTYEAH
jgi:uncharacterized protein YggE